MMTEIFSANFPPAAAILNGIRMKEASQETVMYRSHLLHLEGPDPVEIMQKKRQYPLPAGPLCMCLILCGHGAPIKHLKRAKFSRI